MNRRRPLTVQSLESRLTMNAGAIACAGHHSFFNPRDTNGDQVVGPRDVLVVINALQVHGELAGNESQGDPPQCHVDTLAVDVNGDGMLSPADALSVINWLQQNHQQRQELSAARETWSRNGPSDYVMVHQWGYSAFIPEVTTTVRAGVIASAVDENGNEKSHGGSFDAGLTVEAVFDLIEQELDQGHFRIEISYDPETGRPTRVYSDPMEWAADDESLFIVNSFIELA
ncbi:DUF6174 domain-containing protein [Stieleria sp.]|uniref:DUF6174 domain-containing protein n=1 Tax=Stieleria sp. TaxID=2795976 RepID=UPI003563A260